jgi:CBS domain-containing protein
LENPLITKLIIRTDKSGTLIVPITYLQRINGVITIAKNYETTELDENELYIVRNLLDKQIIDITGNKIVRVNDVVLQDKPILLVSGVDIGMMGIFRWLRLEDPILKFCQTLHLKASQKVLSWADIQPLELARGAVKLKTEEEKLEKVRPEDLADHLEQTNIVNVKKILNILDEKFAAEVIGNLNINYQTTLFKHFSPEKAAKVIAFIDPDEAVDILLTLPKQKREQIIELLPPKKKHDVMYLLHLSKTPIGELITSEFITVRSDETARQVLDRVKKDTNEFSHYIYVYIVNNQNQLVGVCNLHELVLQPLEAPVYKFMIQNVVVMHLSTPEEIAIKKLLKYKLNALPVIDENKHILGIVTLYDVAELILKKLHF